MRGVIKLMFKEDSRTELKEVVTDKLEEEVIAFLNKNGGNIYIGISDSGKVIGINANIDSLQNIIKDRIKNNISPTTIGLFDIDVEIFDNKEVINIIVANGNEKPYYLKSKGMTYEGCFIRIGSSVEHMHQNEIDDMLSVKLKPSLKKIVSPKQKLTFSQLKIYYEEMGYPINNNFLEQLNLKTEDGKFNYLAYLLADNNEISIKVATYSTTDSYDLIESEEYGYCCLIKSAKNIINKFNQVNKTFTKITYEDRKEVKLFDSIAVKEAITNALVHNAWEREYPPKFEIFSDHISISSTGGLPRNFTEEDFLNGFSAPRYPELMRVFKDLDLVEQLGTGIIRILKAYDKSVYQFYPNFIRVNFNFDYPEREINKLSMFNDKNMPNIQIKIINLMKQDRNITQDDLAKNIGVSRSTIARQIKLLIEENKIKRSGSKKNGYWEII